MSQSQQQSNKQHFVVNSKCRHPEFVGKVCQFASFGVDPLVGTVVWVNFLDHHAWFELSELTPIHPVQVSYVGEVG